MAVRILGTNNVNPLALLAKLFAAVPKTTAITRKIKPKMLFTNKRYYYLVILSTNFLIGGPTIRAANIAIGKLTVQALMNRFIYWLSMPVFMKVIIKVISRLMPNPIISINKRFEYFFENITFSTN
tara:strand:+ start:850 stop:1227 length:378 start_codon:yes stop_codon:yes gene_type:complete